MESVLVVISRVGKIVTRIGVDGVNVTVDRAIGIMVVKGAFGGSVPRRCGGTHDEWSGGRAVVACAAG